jgi:hypothetical protein
MGNIHGKEVHFSHDTEEAERFLKHEGNRHVAEEYLSVAETSGKAHFFAGSKEYRIEKEEGEKGENKFSVHVHHHS